MVDEKEMVEVESLETDKKVEEVFAVLFQLPLGELRVLYQKEFKVALKGNDKQKITMRIAKKIVAKGEASTIVPETGKSKSVNTVTEKSSDKNPVPETLPSEAGLTPKEATLILDKARISFVNVDSLKAKKREEMRGYRGKLTKAKDKITEVLRDDGDPEVRIEKLEATWSLFQKVEAKKLQVGKEYNSKIKDASQELRDVLTNIRQPSLPFYQDDQDDNKEN